MNVLINIFWFVWEIKYILFWLYLWQLKEYHIGRFADHFNTKQGKKLLFSVPQIIKVLLLFLLLILPEYLLSLSVLLFIIYAGEFVFIGRALYKRSFKSPVLTNKVFVIAFISFVLLLLFFIKTTRLDDLGQTESIILFDIFTPLIISFVIIVLQPISVVARNRMIAQAKDRLKDIKKHGSLKVIAITGSYGKTTTKEFLHAILSHKYKVLKTPKHQNSEIGIAKEILENLTKEHQFFIAEVGAYNKGKVKEVCSFLNPQIGIVTGVNEQHLALFGSMKNLLLAEGGGELEQSLPNNGLLVLNGDNKHCRDLYKRTEKQTKIYADSNKTIDADMFAEDITVYKDKISFIGMDNHGHLHNFSANVLGRHNVHNLLAAIITANSLGMSFEEISNACNSILPQQAGMTEVEGKHGIQIVDSSYSANPDGVYADLNYLSVYGQKKVVIMPSLIELGNKSSEIHYKIGQKIAQICDLAIVTTYDQFNAIRSGAMDSGMESKNIIFCEKSSDIYTMVTLFCKKGDAVLLEGRVPSALIKYLTV